jgi:hypothetical protein
MTINIKAHLRLLLIVSTLLVLLFIASGYMQGAFRNTSTFYDPMIELRINRIIPETPMEFIKAMDDKTSIFV